jgi:hypothetical protein
MLLSACAVFGLSDTPRRNGGKLSSVAADCNEYPGSMCQNMKIPLQVSGKERDELSV